MLEDYKDIFHKNIYCLRQYHPDLAFQLEQHTPSQCYQFYQTDSGEMSLNIEQKSRIIFLHSRRSPSEEANREIESIQFNEPLVYIMLGIGLGYTLDAILEKCDLLYAGVYIIERDINIFYFFLHRQDWSHVLMDPKIHFTVGDRPESVAKGAYCLLPQIMGSGVRFIDHRRSVQIDNDFYSKVVLCLRQLLEQAVKESEFLARYGGLIQRNCILNFPAMLKSHGLGPLRDYYKKLPAILISAGPSLTINIAHLAQCQDHFIIFCVDTAFRIALEHGIKPDFVAATDPTELNQIHFQGIEWDPSIVLLFESDVFPSIPKMWQGPTIFLNSEKSAINQWAERINGPFGTFEQSLSVAHTLLTAATWMGCDPIILIGYDLAYSTDTLCTHAHGTLLNRPIDSINAENRKATLLPSEYIPESTEEEINWVLGVQGNKVPTSKTMKVFLDFLSDMVKKLEIMVYDATEGGALIEGTIPTHFRQIIQSIDTRPIPKTIASFLNRHQDNIDHNLISEIDALYKGQKQAEEDALEGLNLVKNLINNIEEFEKAPLYSDKQEIKKLDEQFWKIYRNQSIQVVLGQALFPSMFMFIRQTKNQSLRERILKYEKFFLSVLELQPHYIEYISDVKNEISELLIKD